MPPSAVPARFVCYQDNTQLPSIYGLMDSTGAFLNSATVKATLLDGNRNVVPNFQNIVLGYVVGSNGDYSGTLTSAFVAAVGTEYVLVIEADSGASHLHIELPAEVRVRKN